MVAILPHDVDEPGEQDDGTGWQTLRQQLFQRRWQREAEDALLTVLTRFQSGLATAGRAGKSRGADTPQARAAALQVIEKGINGVIGWHREQLQAARAAGWWDQPVPEVAEDLLAQVRHRSTLFVPARVEAGSLECGEVVCRVEQSHGAEGNALFAELLEGLTAMLRRAYERLSADAPTAATALALEETWDELMAEIEALGRQTTLTRVALTPAAAADDAASAPASAAPVTSWAPPTPGAGPNGAGDLPDARWDVAASGADGWRARATQVLEEPAPDRPRPAGAAVKPDGLESPLASLAGAPPAVAGAPLVIATPASDVVGANLEEVRRAEPVRARVPRVPALRAGRFARIELVVC